MTNLIPIVAIKQNPSNPRADAQTQESAQKALARLRRYGSHRVKVAIRRYGHLTPIEALAMVTATARS